jgi:hypothetical protein
LKLRFLAPTAACLVLAACANYHLGTGARLAFGTLYIAPIQNKVVLPQDQAVLTARLREAFARDGRVALVDSPQEADATLTVTVTGYRRDTAAVREADTGLASKFTLTLTTACTLRDARTGRAYFENRPIATRRNAFTDNGQPFSPLTGDQLQSEYNTLPILAESLANAISHAVLDVW